MCVAMENDIPGSAVLLQNCASGNTAQVRKIMYNVMHVNGFMTNNAEIIVS
jgi:hypothetical protein